MAKNFAMVPCCEEFKECMGIELDFNYRTGVAEVISTRIKPFVIQFCPFCGKNIELMPYAGSSTEAEALAWRRALNSMNTM